MLTPSRERPGIDPLQTARILLHRSRQNMAELTDYIVELPRTFCPAALRRIGNHIAQISHEIDETHALIDLQMLLAVEGTWAHPGQAIARPRACYGRVAVACAKLVDETEEGPARERLEYFQNRLLVAHQVHEKARRRRLAMAREQDWNGEDSLFPDGTEIFSMYPAQTDDTATDDTATEEPGAKNE